MRAAVIGCGVMGRRYAAILASMPDVDLVAVADPDPAARAAVAGARGFPDQAALLAAVQPDAVFICTPDHLHREPALAALAAGCAVLVEKPLASTVADAEAICRAATGRLAMVGHLLRFDSRHAAARAAVPGLGDLVYVHASRYAAAEGRTRYAPAVTPISHLMIHDLDLIRWVTGQDVAAVLAATVDRSVAAAHLRLAGGAMAAVESVWALPQTFAGHVWTDLTLVGTGGTLQVPTTHPSVIRHDDHGVVYTDPTRFFAGGGLRPAGVLAEQVAAFVAAVRSGGPSPVPVEEGLAAVRLAAAVEEAARRCQPST